MAARAREVGVEGLDLFGVEVARDLPSQTQRGWRWPMTDCWYVWSSSFQFPFAFFNAVYLLGSRYAMFRYPGTLHGVLLP